MRVRFLFEPAHLWVGVSVDRYKHVCYVCVLPTIGFTVQWAPDPIVGMRCPKCYRAHIDKGEWTTRLHRVHLCEGCGTLWAPFSHCTVGVP